MARELVISLACAAGFAAVLIGCRQEEPPPPASNAPPPVSSPASEQRIAEIRARFERENPGVLVGRVVDTLPGNRLAAVRDVPLDQFRDGQVVTFINTAEQPVDTGVVTRVTDQSVIVLYDPPAPGRRAPEAGDLMVRVPERR